MQTRVPGGYAVVTVQQLTNLCALKEAGRISFAALRVWLAAVEQLQKRCGAKHSVRFTHQELQRLAGGVGERSLLQALRELTREGLIYWSETRIELLSPELPEALALREQLGTSLKRPVPIPRRILRLLAKHTKPAEVIAAIAHLIRCLFKQGRALNLKGFVRAEWVAATFRVSVRAVYAARAWLIRLGVLLEVPVHQLVMNRHGALFLVRAEALPGAAKPNRKSAGLLKSSTRSCTSKNQIKEKDKPALRAPTGYRGGSCKPPTLSDIVPDDLKRLSRLEALYRQAIQARWLTESELSARNFLAAAVRAVRVSTDPARIFVGLVRKGLWHHVNLAEESRAIEAFARHERQTGRRFGQSPLANADPRNSMRQMIDRTVLVNRGEGRVATFSESLELAQPVYADSNTCRVQAALIQKRSLLKGELIRKNRSASRV